MIKAIKGQSVSLRPSNQADFNERNFACSQDNTRFCQSVVKNQITDFQVRLLPSTNIDLVTNNHFANNINSWGLAGTMTASHSSQYGGSAFLSSTNTGNFRQTITGLTVGKYYRGELMFRDFTRLSNNSLITYATINTNPTPSNFLRANTIFYFPNIPVTVRDKRAVFWFTASATSHTISVDVQNASVLVEYVSMYEMTTPIANVNTCDGEEVFEADVRFFKDNAVISVNWNNEDIEVNGCYKICVTPDGNISNNLFSNLNAFVDNFQQTIIDNSRTPIIGG